MDCLVLHIAACAKSLRLRAGADLQRSPVAVQWRALMRWQHWRMSQQWRGRATPRLQVTMAMLQVMRVAKQWQTVAALLGRQLGRAPLATTLWMTGRSGEESRRNIGGHA